MTRREGPMGLVMFFAPTGRMNSAWRSPTAPVERLWSLDHAAWIAEQAERAKFDALFFADVLYVAHGGGDLTRNPFSTGYEPITTIGALAGRTRRLGLIGTISTTFVHPYNMARYLASLDWLTAGRVGWNVVTSQKGEEHYGIELPPSDERYDRAQEYVDQTKALWDAWDDDAVVNDREGATWARSDRIHPVRFDGQFHDVAGQLFLSRSPQGSPVIVQAGQSARGMDFAAKNAEVIFTAQTDLDLAQDFYREIKERAATAGRSPDSVKVLPGCTPIVGESAADARAIEDRLDQYIDVEAGVQDLNVALQADLRGLDVDQPIPDGMLADPDNVAVDAPGGSRYRNLYNMAVKQRLPIRRIMGNYDRALGHSSASGSLQEVADQLQEWYESRACDGFALTPVSVPEGVQNVVDVLMPELRRRGLARTEYEGPTLRDHLGLPRPGSPRRNGRVPGAA